MPKTRSIRIIPRLDVKGPNLVKGIHLEGLRVLGPPEYFAKVYYEEGADELIYIDIVASLYGRNNLRQIVERTAKDIFIPITVGGGIRNIDDIRLLLQSGADKVAINTQAIQNPNLITEAAKVFGSQCIVASIQAKRIEEGIYEAFTDNGRQETGVDVFKWAHKLYELGAGEILITSIDRDGTGRGYDIELITKIADAVPIPVIACGGAGKLEHIIDVIDSTKASAISAASVFHYHYLDKGLIHRRYEEGNIEFLKEYSQKSNYRSSRIEPLSIADIKINLKNSKTAYTRPVPIDSYLCDKSEVPESSPGRTNDYNPLIGVIDFGCGNLFSVVHALKKIGAYFKITHDSTSISQFDKLILPGVGSFGEGMSRLKKDRLIEPIRESAKAGKHILGVCLGMQLLMSEGEEFGSYKGLDLIKGKVSKFRIPPEQDAYYKIPHVGWNEIKVPPNRNKAYAWKNSILEDILPGSLMYFVHSYVVIPDDPTCILAETEYGNNIFCSVVQDNNICGCQFHPERSGEVGLSIYRQFVFGECTNAFKGRGLKCTKN